MDTPASPALVVFSDLDGTLLDHATYSFAAARPALAALKSLGLPLVLASSKTAPEIARLRREIGVEHCPAIVENGAGVIAPGPQSGAMPGATYARLRAALDGMPAGFRSRFEGFGDWSAEEIARRTGLPVEQAALAGQRQFSEPGIWSGNEHELDRYLDALAARGIAAQRGGRFVTLSFGATKADRMAEILEDCAGGEGARPRSLALGDAPNDVEMLERADLGVIIANPGGAGLRRLAGEDTGRIRRSRRAGPAGWNDCVLEILAEAGLLRCHGAERSDGR